MSMTPLDPNTRRAYAANVRRFYLYKFFIAFQLWFSIWVVYLQGKRGLSLTQVTAVDSVFWLVIVFAEMPTGARDNPPGSAGGDPRNGAHLGWSGSR
jgi:hypothetical protein